MTDFMSGVWLGMMFPFVIWIAISLDKIARALAPPPEPKPEDEA